MNSALNPEAPEFYPHLKTVTKVRESAISATFFDDNNQHDGYTNVNKSIRSSNHLPVSASYALFKTYTSFNIVTSRLSENVVEQSNQILSTELPGVKLKRNDHNYNTDKVVDANESMLDRVNTCIDGVCKINKSSDHMIAIHPAINVSSWNKSTPPVIEKIKMGATTFIGAKNIPRPQITFKDAIDNSSSLWVPKISDKPNNIKPLALNILYSDDGEAIGYEHPYKVELNLYEPPARATEPDPEPEPTFPAPLEGTQLTYVDTGTQVDDLVKHLCQVNEMAVDVEHHSYRTYQGITCLIQITTDEGGDFIIDALAVREHIHKLNLVFTDPKKIKVFHGAEHDVLWLQRDFGVYIVGLFDTYHAAKTLALSGLSLKHLLMKYCQVDADKKYQMADWRMRPLPEELIKYARMDTHCLLYIWRKMKNELLEKAAGQPHLLLSVFEQSRHICGTTYNKQVIHDHSHMPIYVRSKKSFNSQQMSALQMLYKWRDEQARELDESTAYLLPNHMLLSLCENLPREVQGVHACCSPMPPFVKQNVITIHRMVLSCRELPLEPQLYHMPPSIRHMGNTAHVPLASYNFHDLSHMPDFREDQAINLDKAAVVVKQYRSLQPDVAAFVPAAYKSETNKGIASGLNVDAKMFIPPYDRYRKYRSLAQVEELKEYKGKEAKIAAIGKGNELIKSEVLNKIQQAQMKVEHEDDVAESNEEPPDEVEIMLEKKAEKRKRRMSFDKQERKDSAPRQARLKNVQNKPETYKNVKPFMYNNVNYRKFYDDTEHAIKQPKQKFKKHK